MTNQNHNLVNQWMTTMENTTKLDLDNSWHQKLQDEFASARITDEEMCKSMKQVLDKFKYFIDPHTAVAVAAAEKLNYNIYDSDYISSNKRPYAILSTASPCKFEESVTIGNGENKWKQYVELEFPSRAASILSKVEVEPTLYQWTKGQTLEEVQVSWEMLARNLVENFK